MRADEQMQWQALGIAPLSYGGATGLRMAATESVEPLDFAPHRAIATESARSPRSRLRPQPVRCAFAAGSGRPLLVASCGRSIA